ncbi:MGMT family protein [bacterium]|nr:MGMT family protein [bacterium]
MNSFFLKSDFGDIQIEYNHEEKIERIQILSKKSKALNSAPPKKLSSFYKELKSHLDGKEPNYKLNDFNFEKLPSFQQTVLRTTFKIPFSATRSYSEIALLSGKPGASRAVGTALKRNPFPLAVPCHRVLKKNGELGQFNAPGGKATKKRLLELEGCSTLMRAKP